MTAFGCDACCDDDAGAAWQHHQTGVDHDPPIVMESHRSARITRCRDCGQAFLHIFTEFIGWSSGDEPQHVTLLPVTGQEAAAFTNGGIPLHEAVTLGAGRRHLNSDWPSGEERRLYWATGTFPVTGCG